ncbi:hypothetical protein [Streptomyces sp. NPDC002889]|uniref:hypothetical protein n=1 Tax=Streptomyces sp. NPDC002889 TaxID=3364669 RepID=UPI0036A444DE
MNEIVAQSVMRFTSASTRNATVLSPVAGMQAFLETEKLMTMYDGTAWVVMAAGASAWTTISLAAGFSHDGNSNGTCQYRVINFYGELSVQLRGGLGITYTGGGGAIANTGIFTNSALPTSARPSSLRTIAAACSAASSTVNSLKVDAQTGGHLLAVGTNTTTDKPPWMSLNGVMYSL